MGMSFWSSNCQHKVHWARFGWEMGCTKFSALISQQLVNRFCPNFIRGRERFETIPCKKLSKFAPAWAGKQIIYQNREVQILTILVSRDLLLKNKTVITSSILGVRSSSLDSRQL